MGALTQCTLHPGLHTSDQCHTQHWIIAIYQEECSETLNILMTTLILRLRHLRVPGQIFTRKPRGSGGCRSLTSETGIMEADDPASANERAAQPKSDQSEAEKADNGS